MFEATTASAGDSRPTLRIATAGDVDDGKSTLLGRLLHDVGAIPADQIAALGVDPDFSRLFDGLEAEREQGITIDVAYRYLTTPARRFVVADAPGHVQYTRNMVTAASGADLALVLVDVSKAAANGLSEQTRRHLEIASLCDVDVVAVLNKLDLVGYAQPVFERVRAAVQNAAAQLHLRPRVLPVAAKPGDNVVSRGSNLSWWTGPTLFETLMEAPVRRPDVEASLRLPAQRVAVLTGDGGTPKRYVLGQIEAGRLKVGDDIRIAPSGERAAVVEVSRLGAPVDAAVAGEAVAVRLDRPIDVTRGDVLTGPSFRLTRRLEADICWMADRPWTPGRRLLLKQATQTTPAFLETLSSDDTPSLARNAIALVAISTRDPILADAYADVPGLGGFVLLDPLTNETAAAGFLRRAVDLDEPDLMIGDGI